jgi:predicted metal-dependent TIM-barrel fold hydrolase
MTTYLFDPHIHMISRTTDDYEKMASAGIRAVVEPAFWLGQPRTSRGTFIDYFKTLLGWERFRARQFGIRHFCTLGLNSKEANNEALADEVMEILPYFIFKEDVLGIGEIGFDEMNAREEKYFQAQLILAREHDLPVQIHTPHRDKKKGTLRSMDLCEDIGLSPEQVLIDHNNEETIAAVLDRGYWAGHTIYPHTKMDAARMVKIVQEYGSEKILVNSSADWGLSDPLAVPKTAVLMTKASIASEKIHDIFWNNPCRFFEKSGQFNKEELEKEVAVDQRNFYEGNSVLRGQEAKVNRNP